MITVLIFLIFHFLIALPFFILIWIILMSLKLVETPEEIKEWIKNLPFITKKTEIIEQRTFTTGQFLREEVWPIIFTYDTAMQKREVLISNLGFPAYEYVYFSEIIETSSHTSNEKTFIFSSRVRKDVKFFTLQIESNTGSNYDDKLLEQFVYCQ